MPNDRDFEDRDEPLSYRIVVSRLPRDGERNRIEAGDRERAALAEFLSILSVERLVAEVTAAPWRRDGVSVKGWLEADVVQESVVTLEPVAQAIREPVALLFVSETSRLARPRQDEDGEIHLDPEGADPPDTYAGDVIDLGAALREILALALDPYPREETAAFEDIVDEPEPAADEKKVSPFAALARLKPRPSDG